MQAYWNGDIHELAEAAKLKPADAGANVQLLVPRDDGVFHGVQTFSGVPAVSALQTYLDLKREPGRGLEAAEVLWKAMLFPTHAAQ